MARGELPKGDPILELGGIRYYQSPIKDYTKRLLLRTLAVLVLGIILIWALDLPLALAPILAGAITIIAAVMLVLKAKAVNEVQASVLVYENGLLLHSARWEQLSEARDKLPLWAHRHFRFMKRSPQRFIPKGKVKAMDLVVMKTWYTDASENIVIHLKKEDPIFLYGVPSKGLKLAAKFMKIPFNKNPILNG